MLKTKASQHFLENNFSLFAALACDQAERFNDYTFHQKLEESSKRGNFYNFLIDLSYCISTVGP